MTITSDGPAWDFIVVDDQRNKISEIRLHMTAGQARQRAADTAKGFDSRHEVKVWSALRDGDLLVKLRGEMVPNWGSLTWRQQTLHGIVEQICGADGADTRDVLIAQDAPARDKAVVAEVFGGAGAGDDFRREHISKRGVCRPCGSDGIYYDGIRDPYWIHCELPEGSDGHLFVPNDARTRLVYEKTSRR